MQHSEGEIGSILRSEMEKKTLAVEGIEEMVCTIIMEQHASQSSLLGNAGQSELFKIPPWPADSKSKGKARSKHLKNVPVGASW